MAGGRDIVVIGGSGGALQPLLRILETLKENLAAAVFVVIHRSAEAPLLLPGILGNHCRLEIVVPEDREPIQLGRVYVPPQDRHLMVKADEIRVVHGPTENGFRPAIDPLFRTASASYGNRVISVILSGSLDDGTHGMLKIQQAGGVTIAQDLLEAEYPDMPRSAVDRVGVDHVLPAAEIGELINTLTNQDIELSMAHPESHADVSEGLVGALRLENTKKDPSPFICPDCGGALWEVDGESVPRYRCHVGHGYTAEILSAMQSAESERLLWEIIRVVEEQGELQRRLAKRSHDKSDAKLARRFEQSARKSERSADLLRSMVLAAANIDTRSQNAAETDETVRREYGAD